MTISTQNSTISSQKTEIAGLKNDVELYRGWWDESHEAAMFMENRIAIIPDDGTNEYHKYGCEDLDLYISSFWAYNTENAIGIGYSACSKCN